MAYRGHSGALLAHITGCRQERISERLRPWMRLWVQLEHLDATKTRTTLAHAMCDLAGRPWPFETWPEWIGKDLERLLGRAPGTGLQTLRAMRLAMAKLYLADPLLTQISILEHGAVSQAALTEVELRRLVDMQTGRLDISERKSVRV